jgi:hypothetical protein
MVFCIAVKGRARLGGPGQAFGLQPALGPFGQARVAEQAPGDGGGVEAVDAGQPVDEPALAVEDVEKLIGVDMQKPAAGPHIGMGEHAPTPAGWGERPPSGSLRMWWTRPSAARRSIRTSVPSSQSLVQTKDMVEADDAVKGDPFEREDALVPHACHDGGLHRVRFRLLGHRVRTA